MTYQYKQGDSIDYNMLIDKAMHNIVKYSLESVIDYVDENGYLPGDHHFYISFLTSHPEVNIPDFLRKEYPHEIAIVIQHQFSNLKIFDKYFTISLSFNGKEANLTIPFESVTSFADPSVKFGLQFQDSLYQEEIFNYDEDEQCIKDDSDKDDISNVVSLDSFRKK